MGSIGRFRRTSEVTKDPSTALKTLYKHEDSSFPLDYKAETKSLHILLPLMKSKTKKFGYQDPLVWKNISNWLYDKRIIKGKVNVNKAFQNLD